MNQRAGGSFNPQFQFLVLEGQEGHRVMEGDQGRGGNDPAQHGVILAVHRVLDGVAQNEQQHQVKGSQLSRLTLAGDSQDEEQEDIHNYAAQDEFPPRQA